jgi:hypothetical protein
MDIPGSSDYMCKCAPGYSGKRCEYLTSLRQHLFALYIYIFYIYT